MENNLISNRNKKLWENDPLTAVKLEIDSIIRQGEGLGKLSYAHKSRLAQLQTLEKEMENKV